MPHKKLPDLTDPTSRKDDAMLSFNDRIWDSLVKQSYNLNPDLISKVYKNVHRETMQTVKELNDLTQAILNLDSKMIRQKAHEFSNTIRDAKALFDSIDVRLDAVWYPAGYDALALSGALFQPELGKEIFNYEERRALLEEHFDGSMHACEVAKAKLEQIINICSALLMSPEGKCAPRNRMVTRITDPDLIALIDSDREPDIDDEPDEEDQLA